jgi:hypothetical protein
MLAKSQRPFNNNPHNLPDPKSQKLLLVVTDYWRILTILGTSSGSSHPYSSDARGCGLPHYQTLSLERTMEAVKADLGLRFWKSMSWKY